MTRYEKITLAISVLALAISAAGSSFAPRAWRAFFPQVSCEAPGDLVEVKPQQAAATSELPQARSGAITYGPGNAIDRDFGTAWSPNDRRGGDGESLAISFSPAAKLALACIVNGYAVDLETYRRNVRLRDVTVATDRGSRSTALRDMPSDSYRKLQKLPLVTGRTNSLRLTINSHYSGERVGGKAAWRDATLSEIVFYAERD